MPPPNKVNIVDPASGKTYGVDEEEAARLEATGEGWVREGAEQKVSRLVTEQREEDYGGIGGKATAFGSELVSTATGGLTDAFLGAIGEGDEVRAFREVNPGSAVAGAVVGGVLPVGVGGLASRAGRAISTTAEGASLATKLGRAAAGGAVEGAIFGTGSGISELGLSKDPLTVERMASVLSSHALFGGAVGGAAGLLTKGAGMGLRRVQSKLDDIATKPAVVDDVARKQLADDVATFRKGTVDDELFLVTKGATDRETKSIAKIWMDADRAVDRVLKSPKSLARDPKSALRALEQQEHALEKVIAKTDELTAKFATDTTTTRIAALGKVPAALEQNRALQSKILDMTATKGGEKGAGSFVQGMVGGQAFGLGASLASAIPVIGPALAPIAGGIASKFVTGGLGKMAADQAARGSKAIGAFLNTAAKVPNVAPVVATKILDGVRFADSTPDQPKPTGNKRPNTPKLADSFKARTAEIKSQTQYDMTGRAIMRPDARQKLGAKLDPIRAADPILADQIETTAARKLEALANRIPRKPDPAAMQVGPTDLWPASDMAMRKFAREVAAAEDPVGIVERLGNGSITPEEVSVFREVYPEMYLDIQQQIAAQLPTLQKTLPYQKRLAFSIFSGMPVDPALDPMILSVIQGQFAQEPNTNGGVQAPTPQPQFGSVRADKGTPSQQREQEA